MFVPANGSAESFNGHTLFIPCISVGNVSQLTIDLLVSTLELHKVGYMYDDSVLPLAGNDPYASDSSNQKCEITTSVEVYASQDKKIAVIQQRAPCVKGKRKQYVTKVCQWIKESNFGRVVKLASLFAHERRDSQLQGSPFRYLTLPGLETQTPALNELGWQPLEKRSDLADVITPPQSTDGATCAADQYFLPGSGSLYEFCKQCEDRKIEALGVLCFCAEGDNAVDALHMAAHLNTYFMWRQLPDTSSDTLAHLKQWKIPSSWQLLFGSGYQQLIY